MHNQDKELQIRLAELQANVQIYIAMAFGFAALFMSIYAVFVQTFFSLPIEARFSSTGWLIISGMLMIMGAFGFSIVYFLRKAVASKDEMEKLKKDYCW